MIEHSDTITKLMGAMLAVQGAVEGVAKDSKNPAFKSSYASLEAVVETIRPHCQKHGLVVMQAPGGLSTEVEGRAVLTVETMIVHAESGEWIKSAMQIPLTKIDAQGAGSAITYGERYSLMAMLNLPPVDDDGEAAKAAHSSLPQSISQRATAAQRASTASVSMAPNARDRAEAQPLPDKEGMLAAIERAGSLKQLYDLIAKPRWTEALNALFPPDRPVVENAIADQRSLLTDLTMAG